MPWAAPHAPRPALRPQLAQRGNPAVRGQLPAIDLARQEAGKFSRRSSASNSGSNHMVGIQLTVLLFTGGARSAKEDQALRLVDKATATLEHTRQQVASKCMPRGWA